ncbi:MAG: apolipoprotein N-acyltransferase, partial [Candidatus Bipolaricaulota bacterium]|nr:apolipoprotein N-acyltransferase [Candidatus Bipolaricaulota bacterium]
MKKAGSALLAGGMIALAMPGIGIGPLVFLCLVPLFFSMEKGRGFLPGFLAGTVFFAVDLRWLLALNRFTPLAIPGYLLLVGYLATHLGLFGLTVVWLKKPGREWTILILAPGCYTLLEMLRAHGPLGIGFCALYQSLYHLPSLIQLTAIAGPWAITAAIVFINASLYLAVRKRPRYLLAGITMIGLLAAFSLLPDTEDEDSLSVAVISSSVSQEMKLNEQNLDPLLKRYVKLGEEAKSYRPDLIIFPESILPGHILQDTRLLNAFQDLATTAGARVLFGTGDVRRGEIYNSVVLISPAGEVSGVYDMVHPVPFGEYIPARGLFEWIGLVPLTGTFLPQDLATGEGFEPIDDIGALICFESTFPITTRRLTANGARLLVAVTNDAWFAKSPEPKSHFAAAVFRAVESRRTLIQAANGGLSGIVDPRGR